MRGDFRIFKQHKGVAKIYYSLFFVLKTTRLLLKNALSYTCKKRLLIIPFLFRKGQLYLSKDYRNKNE